jgi:hypothetical protein
MWSEIQDVYRLWGVRINDKHIGLHPPDVAQGGDLRYRRYRYLRGEQSDRIAS